MADFQIPDKTLLTAVDRAADSWLIYDNSATALKRTTINYALDLTSHPVGVDDTQTLTAKTLTSPTINNATVANPTLTVDTVSEYTTANGVTIDSLNIKDGKLNTNDSVVTANITNKAVTEEKISDGWVHGSDGWIDSTQTWTYVSATSFKITGTDVTAQFPVGTKIKLTQTTAKYFYVTAATFSTDTTVTVTGGSDYTLANAAITSPMYSYIATPQGFPDWFAWTPTLTNISDGTLTYAEYTQVGKTVKFRLRYQLAGAGITGAPNFTVPIAANADYAGVGKVAPVGNAMYYDANGPWVLGFCYFNNSSTTLTLSVIKADVTYATVTGLTSAIPFTWASGDAITLSGTYEAA